MTQEEKKDAQYAILMQLMETLNKSKYEDKLTIAYDFIINFQLDYIHGLAKQIKE